jgi:hypothetical protein
LKKVDKFGNPVKLTYNKNKTIETSMGGICTIFVFILLLVLFVSRISGTFVGLNFIINTQEELTKENEDMTLTYK